jgi:hypothetical protein
MNEKEIGERLEEIRSNMTLFDGIVSYDFKTGKHSVSEKQADIISKLLDLFRDLGWQLAFNSYKELKYSDGKTIMFGKRNLPGTPVKVRPCNKKFGDKTYFGILIGDVATSLSHSIDNDGNLTASFGQYNPAIIIPELGEIVFGYESWWEKIWSKEELDKVITDETIRNVWYVKMLSEI